MSEILWNSLIPLFIAKMRWRLPPCSPKLALARPSEQMASSGRAWKAQVGQVAICTTFLLNAPPFYFFGNSFSVTLRNFTKFVTILISLPQGYESLRIMYLLFFSFRRSYGNSRIAQKHLFSTSASLRNFTDRASLLPFDFRDVSGLHLLCNQGRQVSRSGQSKVVYHQIIIPGRN